MSSRATLWETPRPLRRAFITVAVVVGVMVLHLLRWTWRKDLHQMARLDALQDRGVPIIVAFWHGSYVPLFVLCRGRQAVVLIAPGFRGDIIAGICRAFGYRPLVLGPAAGASARAHLKAALGSQAPTVAVAIDGPLGPRHEPKLGMLHLAGTLGYQIVPMSVRAWPMLGLSHRWDRMAVPLPFAKVAVHIGPPITIPAQTSPAALQDVQRAVRQALGDGANARPLRTGERTKDAE